ncbi:MAG: hypothetical protein WKG00_23305 [Polyangiaceae bacterium]
MNVADAPTPKVKPAPEENDTASPALALAAPATMVFAPLVSSA